MHSIPEWKAPASLLKNVMDVIDTKERASGFFAWPLFYRYLFGAGVLAVICGLFTIDSTLVFWPDFLSYMKLIYSQLLVSYKAVIAVDSVVLNFANFLPKQPLLMAMVVPVCIAIFAAWTGSVAVLYQMFHVTKRG